MQQYWIKLVPVELLCSIVCCMLYVLTHTRNTNTYTLALVDIFTYIFTNGICQSRRCKAVNGIHTQSSYRIMQRNGKQVVCVCVWVISNINANMQTLCCEHFATSFHGLALQNKKGNILKYIWRNPKTGPIWRNVGVETKSRRKMLGIPRNLTENCTRIWNVDMNYEEVSCFL